MNTMFTGRSVTAGIAPRQIHPLEEDARRALDGAEFVAATASAALAEREIREGLR